MKEKGKLFAACLVSTGAAQMQNLALLLLASLITCQSTLASHYSKDSRVEHRLLHEVQNSFFSAGTSGRASAEAASSLERSAEINRRFARHLGALFQEVSSRRLSEGMAWARKLECQPGCLHGGVCQLDTKTKQPMCLCPLPDPTSGVYFRGSSCQTEAVRCNSTWWCENGGTCQKLEDSTQEYTCACPHAYRGTKCQTPVSPCGELEEDLWCANGGTCVFSMEANSTICKCPSTHSGTNCETLVEPQDLARAHTEGSFSSPVVLPPNSDVKRLEDEQEQYFKEFFLIFGVFLSIWMTALAVVHCPRPRHQLKRRIASLRGELTPLKARAGQDKKDKGQPAAAAAALEKHPAVTVVERMPSRGKGLASKPREEEQQQQQQEPQPREEQQPQPGLHPGESSPVPSSSFGAPLAVTPDASDMLQLAGTMSADVGCDSPAEEQGQRHLVLDESDLRHQAEFHANTAPLL